MTSQVLGGLADLPVTVRERVGERGVDLRTVERGQRQDRPSPDRRAVAARGEDRGQAAGVADRAERGDRRLADRAGPGACARPRRARATTRARVRPVHAISPSAHAADSATSGSVSARSAQQPDDGRGLDLWRELGRAPPHRGGGIGRRVLPRRAGASTRCRGARAAPSAAPRTRGSAWVRTAASSSASGAARGARRGRIAGGQLDAVGVVTDVARVSRAYRSTAAIADVLDCS